MLKLNRETIRYLRGKHCIDKNTCLLILIFLGIALFVATGLLLSPPPQISEEAREYSECNHYYADKSVCYDARSDDGSQERKSKSTTNEYSPNQYVREKRDLNAQEGMWRATNALVYFTLIQIFIGLGGVIIIALTLQQTGVMLKESRKTTAAANRTADSAEKAGRAYLILEPKWEFIDSEGRVLNEEQPLVVGNRMRIVIAIRNIGKSPAIGVQCIAKFGNVLSAIPTWESDHSVVIKDGVIAAGERRTVKTKSYTSLAQLMPQFRYESGKRFPPPVVWVRYGFGDIFSTQKRDFSVDKFYFNLESSSMTLKPEHINEAGEITLSEQETSNEMIESSTLRVARVEVIHTRIYSELEQVRTANDEANPIT